MVLRLFQQKLAMEKIEYTVDQMRDSYHYV